MSNKFKGIDINHKYYFFHDIINTKNSNPSKSKIEKKSYKNILIYYIGYVTMKDSNYVNSVNPLYLIINKVNGCFEETNKYKFVLMRAMKKLKNMKNCGVKSEIELGQNYKFRWLWWKVYENELPLKKTTEIPTTTFIIFWNFLMF